ncbi:hypothetical protein G6F36_005133 [Rhizopus arrhizus]|nr:hypothetical protein G6F36_005133 [Rhizopus arrhizus]
MTSSSKLHKADITADTPWMQPSNPSNPCFSSNNSEDNKQTKIKSNSSTNTPPTLVDMRVEKNTEGKPPYSYATLIKYAIERSPGNKLTLSQIYQWVIDHYPYYGSAGSGWKNSIRHNLSLNKSFIRIPRPVNEPGKGSYWTVDQYAQQNSSKLKATGRCKKSSGELNRAYSDPWPNNRRSFSTDAGQMRSYSGYCHHPYNTYDRPYGYPSYQRPETWLSGRHNNSNITYSLPPSAVNNLKNYESLYDVRSNQYPSTSLFYTHRQSCPDLTTLYPETAVVPSFGLHEPSDVSPACDKAVYSNTNQSDLLKDTSFAYDHHSSPSGFYNNQNQLNSPVSSPTPTDNNNYRNDCINSPSSPLIMANSNSPIEGVLKSPYYSSVSYLDLVSQQQSSSESLVSSCSSSPSPNGLCHSPNFSQLIPDANTIKNQQEPSMISSDGRFGYQAL